MSNDRPVIVRLESGAEYGLPSIAKAKSIYPNGKIVKYQDGTMIDPADLGDAGLSVEGEVEVSEKLTRAELEAIATSLGIEGADNKSAFKDKAALVEEIEAVRAETASVDDGGEPDSSELGSTEANADTSAAGSAESGEGESE